MTTDNEQMREALERRIAGIADEVKNDFTAGMLEGYRNALSELAALSAPARLVEAVALTAQQRADAAWGYVEDSRNLSDRERELMQSTERAVWAANNLAAPKD